MNEKEGEKMKEGEICGRENSKERRGSEGKGEEK